MNITQHLEPEQIQKVFGTLRELTVKKKTLEIQKKELEHLLANEVAILKNDETAIDPKWNLGKNPEERDATVRGRFPHIVEQIDNIVLEIDSVNEQKALAHIDADEVKCLISYFRTIEIGE